MSYQEFHFVSNDLLTTSNKTDNKRVNGQTGKIWITFKNTTVITITEDRRPVTTRVYWPIRSITQVYEFSLWQWSLATYCSFLKPLLYYKTKTWLWTPVNFEPQIFNGKSLQLLLLKFRRKSCQFVGEMCIFDNPLFYAEFVAYFDQKIQTEF